MTQSSCWWDYGDPDSACARPGENSDRGNSAPAAHRGGTDNDGDSPHNAGGSGSAGGRPQTNNGTPPSGDGGSGGAGNGNAGNNGNGGDNGGGNAGGDHAVQIAADLLQHDGDTGGHHAALISADVDLGPTDISVTADVLHADVVLDLQIGIDFGHDVCQA
jgi:hypothetical protein